MIYLSLCFVLCALYQIRGELTNSPMWIHERPPQHFFVDLLRQSSLRAVSEEHKAVPVETTEWLGNHWGAF